MHRKLVVQSGGALSVTQRSRHKKPLISAHGTECFWVHEGPVVSTLEDLCRALGAMSDAQYNHHVTRFKNDFSAWVKEILLDDDCAERLLSATTRIAARRVVEEALKEYTHG